MTALSGPRNTKEALGDVHRHSVAASVNCFAGGLAVLDSSGDAKPGVTATGLIAVGRFEQNIDNSTGSAGDVSVNVKGGTFRYANSSAADEITKAEIGRDCYIVDDQTVAKTDGTASRSVAGKIAFVDTLGVWVALGPTT